jgi:3'(2'), 5'-bisphosphate nucleotidase
MRSQKGLKLLLMEEMNLMRLLRRFVDGCGQRSISKRSKHLFKIMRIMVKISLYLIIYKDMSHLKLDWLDFRKIVEIVEIASQIILQIYLNDDLFMNMSIENKEDNSPLTIADKKANDFICRELRGLYPDIPIISEENKNDDWEVRQKYTWAWLVDPLDGTKEFIKRNGEFTVNIGLVYKGLPSAGFVGIPTKGLIYWGSLEGGAWKKEIDCITNLRDAVKFLRKDNVIRIVASRSHMDAKTDEFIQKNYVEKGLKVDLLNVGSSMKILWIAENRADVYPRLAPTMEWDTCAAHAILNACGGTLEIAGVHDASSSHPDASGLGVSSPFLKGAAELSYNKSNLLNPYFIGRLKSQFE